MSVGFDYGAGRANMDAKTGIRYGVIKEKSIEGAWYIDSEPCYFELKCPDCDAELVEFDDEKHGDYTLRARGSYADFACESCRLAWSSNDACLGEPEYYFYRDERYELETILDNCVIVMKSPYYTFTKFCSPCVPGAGDLDSPDPDGVKTYCLGHDWFEEAKAPYPVYRVQDDARIEAACGLCYATGVSTKKTTACGKIIGVECGCNEYHADDKCDNSKCQACQEAK
jgi:hypothetical protein